MSLKVMKERPEWGDVYERTKERIDFMYREFETVLLSYSGGKDSHLVLELLLDGWDRPARKNHYDGQIHLMHVDDEFVFPETEEHVLKYAKRPEVKMWWCCLPIRYTNSLTDKKKFWKPFDPEKKDVWIRDPPYEEAEEIDDFELVTPDHPAIDKRFVPGKTKHKDLPGIIWDSPEDWPINSATGVRADEAMYRYQSIMQQGKWSGLPKDAEYDPNKSHRPGTVISKPAYDWTDHDLWHAFYTFDHWECNAAYDKLAQMGIPPSKMRTAHPYGPEAVNNAAYKRVRYMWPELYEKARCRVEGGMFGLEHGDQLLSASKQTDQRWSDRVAELIDRIEDDELKEKQRARVQNVLNKHDEKATFPLPDSGGCEFCGMSWYKMAKALEHGDLNQRQF